MRKRNVDLTNHNNECGNLHEIYSSFPARNIRDVVFSTWRTWKLPGLMDTAPEALAALIPSDAEI